MVLYHCGRSSFVISVSIFIADYFVCVGVGGDVLARLNCNMPDVTLRWDSN